MCPVEMQPGSADLGFISFASKPQKSSQEAKNSQRREEMGVRENKVEKAEGKKKKEDRA